MITLEELAAMRVAEPCAGVGGMASGFEAQGFQSVWFAEIVPYCRRVLRHHFPEAKVYKDLNDLTGHGASLVRKHGRPLVYAGGTPCQDLSVAGHRKGLKGARSGLFYAFMDLWSELGSPLCLWENVPGALSSHGGKDFARVLGAFVGERFTVPRVKRRGDRLKWPRAGVIAGPAGVAAWRVLDAQYFGVPQRRRRLFVLGSRSSLFDPRAILLDDESLRGDPAASQAAWEAVASRLGDGAETARLRNDRSARRDGRDGREGDRAPGEDGQETPEGGASLQRDAGPLSVAFRKAQRAHSATDCETWVEADVAPTLNGFELEGSDIRATTIAFGPQDNVADPVSHNEQRTWTHEGNTFRTHNVIVPEAFGFKASHFTRGKDGEPSGIMPPLSADADKGDQDAVIFQPNDRVAGTVEATIGRSRGAGTPVPMLAIGEVPNVSRSITARQGDSVRCPSQEEILNTAVGIPRRLMPVECERLQGWPDGWTNVPKRTTLTLDGDAAAEDLPSDAKRYRAIGNGVAKPVAQWIAWRIRLAAAHAYLTLAEG